MRIGIAQINLHVGNVEANMNKILEYMNFAREEKKLQMVIFPELTLTGYPPEDLLLRPALYEKIRLALDEILNQSDAIDIIIGCPEKHVHGLFNACYYISNGKIMQRYYKKNLPNYGVFDEKRYFMPGEETSLISLDRIPTALSICEDLWTPGPAKQVVAAGAKMLININASPYHAEKGDEREALLKQRVDETNLSIIYVNLVGGQDELIFDGNSMIINNEGEVVFKAPQFEEDLYAVEVSCQNENISFIPEHDSQPLTSKEASIYNALVLGVRDYVNKNGFAGAVIGLSGGIDSALTLVIAVDALGAENIEVLLMPSRYTADMSIQDSIDMADKLHVCYHVISIEKAFQTFTEILKPVFKDLPIDTTEENIQARCRGILLMAVSNKTGKLVLTTGNKSEMAVGYATLYGDMAGGFAPLKDVSKTLAYRLAHWRNQQGLVIPQRIIDRPPSAELRPDQKDVDTLPPYEILDVILERYIEQDQSPDEIIRAGYDEHTVHDVARMVDRNEYKRRQAAPGIRISKRAFGRDRRYPITSGYREF